MPEFYILLRVKIMRQEKKAQCARGVAQIILSGICCLGSALCCVLWCGGPGNGGGKLIKRCSEEGGHSADAMDVASLMLIGDYHRPKMSGPSSDCCYNFAAFYGKKGQRNIKEACAEAPPADQYMRL